MTAKTAIGSVLVENASKERFRWHVESVKQPNEGSESDLALAALDPRYLHRGEPSLAGQILLSPASLVSGTAYVLAK